MTDIERKARISYAIRAAREARGISRPELARRVGVGRGAVSDWENGETLPSLLNLGPLCDALQVDADLFAHPPEIPASPIRDFLLDRGELSLEAVAAAEAAADEVAARATRQADARSRPATPDDEGSPRRTDSRGAA